VRKEAQPDRQWPWHINSNLIWFKNTLNNEVVCMLFINDSHKWETYSTIYKIIEKIGQGKVKLIKLILLYAAVHSPIQTFM
jgi:hypothetical protein